MTSDTSGPHLQAALICERVLTEQDGALTPVRIIDRVTFMATPDGELLNGQHQCVLLVCFKSGAARGRHTIEITMERPSGEIVPVLRSDVHLEGEERGVNLVINTSFEPEHEGLYWFDVAFGGERVTRVPLRAVYQPIPTQGSPG